MSNELAKQTLSENLVTDNPMMSEVGRNLKKISGFNLPAPARKGALIFLGVFYAFCLVLITVGRGGPAADVILFLQTLAFCLIVPSVTHGVIVGEREKRSWDMLLVAPVSPMQIVVAKYATGVSTIGVASAFLLPFILIGAIGSSHTFASLVLAEVVSLTFGLCLNAFALAVSARAKRALHAQTAIFGTVAGTLLLWPMLISILAPSSQGLVQVLNLLNPFMVIAQILMQALKNSPFEALAGWQVVFYLVATMYFLRSAYRNVIRDINQDGD